MKLLAAIFMLALLAGCTTSVVLIGANDAIPHGTGTLYLTWLQPHSIKIQLDGKRYVGEWTSQRCATDSCRDSYRNVSRIHRRHIDTGHALLTANDGATLECRWVSHLPEVDGACHTPDGRKYELKWAGEKDSASSLRPANENRG